MLCQGIDRADEMPPTIAARCERVSFVTSLHHGPDAVPMLAGVRTASRQTSTSARALAVTTHVAIAELSAQD